MTDRRGTAGSLTSQLLHGYSKRIQDKQLSAKKGIRKRFVPRSNIPGLKKIIWGIGVQRRTSQDSNHPDDLFQSRKEGNVCLIICLPSATDISCQLLLPGDSLLGLRGPLKGETSKRVFDIASLANSLGALATD